MEGLANLFVYRCRSCFVQWLVLWNCTEPCALPADTVGSYCAIYWDMAGLGDTRTMLGLHLLLTALISGIYNIQIRGQIRSPMNLPKAVPGLPEDWN